MKRDFPASIDVAPNRDHVGRPNLLHRLTTAGARLNRRLHVVIDYAVKRRDSLPSLVLAVCAAAVAVPYLAYWFGQVSFRVLEPYATGWVEPVFYAGALRVFEGLPIYAAPTIDYVSPIYGPGMPVVGGVLFALFGPGYPPLRIFSLACLAGLVAVAAAWIRRETGSWRWAWVPGFLMLVLDKSLKHWFMRANADIPYLFLVFLALFLMHSMRVTNRSAIAAGVCMAFAALFKQNALLMAFAAGVYLLLHDRKAFAFYVGAMAAILVPAAVVLHIVSDGWFWTIAGRIPSESVAKDGVDIRGAMKKLSTSGFAAFAVSAALLTAADRGRRRTFWFVTCAAAFALSCRSFAKQGSGMNCMLPVMAFASVAPLLLLDLVARAAAARFPGRLIPNLWAAIAFLLVFAAVPDGALRAPAEKKISFPKYQAFDDSVRKEIDGVDGPVFVGARPDILHAAGRPGNFHQSPLYDGTFRTSVYDLGALLDGPLSAHHWEKMIVWEYEDKSLVRLVSKYYTRARSLKSDPLIGVNVGVWVPKESDGAARDASAVTAAAID